MPALLQRLRLAHGDVSVETTPRRLAVIVHGVSCSQPDVEEKIRGPPAKVLLLQSCPDLVFCHAGGSVRKRGWLVHARLGFCSPIDHPCISVTAAVKSGQSSIERGVERLSASSSSHCCASVGLSKTPIGHGVAKKFMILIYTCVSQRWHAAS